MSHAGHSVSKLDSIGGHSAHRGGVWTILTKTDVQHGPIVLKPLGTEGHGMCVKGAVEYRFYDEQLREQPFAEFCPRYFGLERRKYGETELEIPYLRLEDITAKYKRANVMDLKIGQRTWDPEASEDKKQREITKYPPQSEVGFRFTGLRVWNEEKQDYDRTTREWCFSRKVDEIEEGLAMFFPERIRDRLPLLLRRLRELEECLVKHPKWRLYASSLLIVYEGDPSADPADSIIDVRAIDFAHVFPIEDEGLDDGYLFGLAKIIQFLERLALSEKKPSR